MTGSTLAVQLGGTGRLADDLYLVAHHEITGKPLPAAARRSAWGWPARCWPS